MNLKRTLSLKRDTLTELTTDDLRAVPAGAAALSNQAGKCTFDDSYLLCTRSCYLGA